MAYQAPSPEERPGYVRGKFDEIASHYDRFNDAITLGQHRLWKRALVKRLALAPGAWGLDLCCGTGDIAQRCLPLVSGAGGIIAADFSMNMLRLAQGRLAGTHPAGASGSTPQQGRPLCADAMRLPFADGAFQFVTVGYGLRNVRDLKGCLGEILRVLEPGGMLASLDMGKVAQPWLAWAFQRYFFTIVPRIGRMLQPGQEMFDYLPHSTMDYPGQQELARLMERLGFCDIRIEEYGFGATALHFARKPE